MRRVSIAVLTFLSAQAWAADPTPTPVLPKERHDIFEKHAGDFYDMAKRIQADLQLSGHDERALLRASQRGFPNLAAIVENRLGRSLNFATFQREGKFKSWSLEEAITAELIDRSIDSTLAAERHACFQLLRELAPTPEAMKVEKQAGELNEKVASDQGPLTEAHLFDVLLSIRALFDQLKDLPKLTPQQLAEEWTANAALSGKEIDQDPYKATKGKQLDPHLYSHQHWNHEGYVLWVTKFDTPTNSGGPHIFVSERGGIFWCLSTPENGAFHYESKLRPSEFEVLKRYLASMPPSKRMSERNHYIVSFENNRHWTTRLYDSLPAGNLFDGLDDRLGYQQSHPGAPGTPDDGYLKPLPEKPKP